MSTNPEPQRISKREYLAMQVAMTVRDLPFGIIREAVSSTAMDHPEWDMNEKRTWDEWEADRLKGEQRGKNWRHG